MGLFLLTLPGCLLFIHFIINNYDQLSQRLSNLLYLELAMFYIFYSTVLLIGMLLFAIWPEPDWKHEMFAHLRMFAAILDFILLLQMSITMILRQHFVDTYLDWSLHFSWNPYLVFKSITIIFIQWLVLEAREDGETSHEKLLNSVLIIRKFVAAPLVSATILAQAVILVGWIYENRVTIVKCFENILCSQSQVSEDPVIELAVISHNQNQNWAQEPIHIQNPVQNFEIFHILISTVIVILYLVNLVLVVFLKVSTFFARTLILLATINTTCYSWIIFNKKLRSHTKSIVIKFLSFFNNILH